MNREELTRLIEGKFKDETRSQIEFGWMCCQLTRNNLRDFISDLVRRPRSGGHKLIKLHVYKAIAVYQYFLNELKKSEEPKDLVVEQD